MSSLVSTIHPRKAPVISRPQLPRLRLEWQSTPHHHGSCYRVVSGDILAIGGWLAAIGFRSAATIPNPHVIEHYWKDGASVTLWMNGQVTCHDYWWPYVAEQHKIDVYALLAPLVEPQAGRLVPDHPPVVIVDILHSDHCAARRADDHAACSCSPVIRSLPYSEWVQERER